MATNSRPRIKVLDRAIDILFCLADAGGELGLAEISQRTSLDKATVHRILATLADRDLVRPGRERGQYGLYFGTLRLSASAFGSRDIRAIARPFMLELSRRSGETVALSVLSGSQRSFVYHIEGQREVRWVPRIGTADDLWPGAAGIALLAHLPGDERERILSKASCAPAGLNSPPDVAGLRREVARAKRDGYAMSLGARYPRNRGIAAPMFDYTHRPVGALTIAGPDGTFDRAAAKAMVGSLLWAAGRVSALLGAAHYPPDGDVGVA